MLRTPGRSTAREWRWNRAWKLCRGVHLPSRVSCEDSPRAAVKPLSSQKFVHFAKLATSSDENKAALVSTVPVKRLATPEEIAHVIVFVASANASYMTGASIPVNGGMLAN